MKGVNMNIKGESNGQLTLTSPRCSITIHPDGTVAISSCDPIQLTGDSLKKLTPAFSKDETDKLIKLMMRSTEKI